MVFQGREFIANLAMSTPVVGKHRIHASASSCAIDLFRWLSLLCRLLCLLFLSVGDAVRYRTSADA